MKIEQSVPKRRHIKFRRRGITQKKAYNMLSFTALVDTRMASMLVLFNFGRMWTILFSMELAVVIFIARRNRFFNIRWVTKFQASGLLSSGIKIKLSLFTPWTHIMGTKIRLHSFITSALDGGEWYHTPAALSLWKNGTCWIRGWSGVDDVEKGRISYRYLDSNFGPSIPSPSHPVAILGLLRRIVWWSLKTFS